MKHSISLQHLQKFTYVDSSDQEDALPKNDQQTEGALPKFMRDEHNLLGKSYKQQLKQLLRQEIQKMHNGNRLLVEPNDHLIHDDIMKRKQKYNYFLSQVEMDEKYRKIIEQKVAILKQQNQRKEAVLRRQRQIQQLKQQQNLFHKHILEKVNKEELAVKGVKNVVRKLGVERNVLTTKQVAAQVKSSRMYTQNKLSNLKQQQKNQIDELRQLYEQVKIQKRTNKIDQQKVLKDLQKMNRKHKAQLMQKLKIKKDFII